MKVLLSRLDEAQRRWYGALESNRLGHGGDRLFAQSTGMDENTIRRGRDELAASLSHCAPDRVRQPGGGRPAVEKQIRRYWDLAGAGRTRDRRRSHACPTMGAAEPATVAQALGRGGVVRQPTDWWAAAHRVGVGPARQRQEA
jgi:hypothetical protein